MKVLSLKQPWAELVVSGRKKIETRKWNTSFRGEFFVHASKNIDAEECKRFGLDPKKIERGGIIGRVTLKDVTIYIRRSDFEKDKHLHRAGLRWFTKPTYGFILENPARTEFIPLKGQLGFFDL